LVTDNSIISTANQTITMKATIISGLAFAATAAAATIPRRGLNGTGGITEAYATHMAESWIVNNREKQRDLWYGRAAIYSGFEALIARTDNDELLDWYRSRIDGLIVTENGTIVGLDTTRYSLDDYRIGNNLLYTPTGGFWHRSPTYPDQMWLDGIFMADSFYSYYTSLFDADNTTAWGSVFTN
jgi:rhamnogalacturonyl hydrolase YesR